MPNQSPPSGASIRTEAIGDPYVVMALDAFMCNPDAFDPEQLARLAPKHIHAQEAELSRLRAVVEEQRWIPVSERLPDADPHSAIVLACSDRGTVRGAYMIWGKTWVWDEFDSAAEHGPSIVAWMPLPKPFAVPNPTTGAE